MSKDNIWFPFYVNDWLGDTQCFNSTQHGLYLQIVCEYWNARGPIKHDLRRLHKMSKLSKRTFDINISEVLEKFLIEDGYLKHKRIDRELAKLLDLKEKRRKGGKASAAKRKAESEQAKSNTCSKSLATVLPLRASDSDSVCPLQGDLSTEVVTHYSSEEF